MRDTIPRKQQTLRRDIAKGYVRIEAEAGGTASSAALLRDELRGGARRGYAGREGERARRRVIERGRRRSGKPPTPRAHTQGNDMTK